MSTLRLAVAGAAGRMGRHVLAAALAAPDIALCGGFVRPGSGAIGQDLGLLAGGSPIGVAAQAGDPAALAAIDAHVLVDFSRAAATIAYAEAAAAAGTAFLTGTTGLTPDQVVDVEAMATRIPTLLAPNTSVGLTALLQLLPALVRALGPDYDLEIVETHHRHKADAPSGTAMAIARTMASARDALLEDHTRFGRQGHAPRAAGEIGIHAVRAGGAAGEHRIILGSEGEQIEILHRATGRQTYAVGALRAARWLAARPPGLYTMAMTL